MSTYYWSDLAPADAKFALYSFLLDTKICFENRLIKLPSPSFDLKVVNKSCLPELKDWKKNIVKALSEKELKKVILARCTKLELELIPNPFAIAAALKQKSSTGATVFCAELSNESYLLGATPERLFRKEGNQIWVEALAGTRSLNERESLISSEKDLREFRLVENHFEEKLSPFLNSPLIFSEIETHQTATLHHLKSVGTGILKPNISEEDLIFALHPSSAILGTPKNLSLEFLKKHELFDRGFYCGLIGWSNGKSCDWKVAIRACHLQGSNATLYVGTGIVNGSVPTLEWEELNIKQSLYKEIFPCAF